MKVFKGVESDMPIGQHKINCHIIWDVKIGDNFRIKARYVAGGHTNDTPTSLTYASVLSEYSVIIALTIATLKNMSLLVS